MEELWEFEKFKFSSFTKKIRIELWSIPNFPHSTIEKLKYAQNWEQVLKELEQTQNLIQSNHDIDQSTKSRLLKKVELKIDKLQNKISKHQNKKTLSR